jgi:DNA polymerase-3 subunit epsilon
MLHSFRWAFIDIETTGLHVTHDKITEIAVIIVTQEGVETTWHSLINPNRSIPGPISALTGITQELVINAPLFCEIALELFALLHDCVLVAHNGRFDFGFLKNAFKKEGFSYQTPVLCTIKLMKQLFPALPQYNLAALAQSFTINNPSMHRAQGDVQTLYELINKVFIACTPTTVLAVAKKIHQKSSIPSKLATDIHAFPETAGVYLFYGSNASIPLYIGKSVSLRQRILSHFQGDYAHAKEFTLAQQVERIEIIPTAGELSALLLESELIKEKMPVYNRKLRRKTQIAGFKIREEGAYLAVSIVREHVECDDDLRAHGIHGAFRSIHAAKRTLVSLIKKHNLCPKLCGLEHTNSVCFSFQLKRCFGACIGDELIELYNQRVLEALKEFKEEAWPYQGAIAIKEYCPINNITQFLVFNQWRHLGTMDNEHTLSSWKELPKKSMTHYFDAYKILLSYLKNKSLEEGSLVSLEH